MGFTIVTTITCIAVVVAVLTGMFNKISAGAAVGLVLVLIGLGGASLVMAEYTNPTEITGTYP